jgi:hypothetical protein
MSSPPGSPATSGNSGTSSGEGLVERTDVYCVTVHYVGGYIPPTREPVHAFLLEVAWRRMDNHSDDDLSRSIRIPHA